MFIPSPFLINPVNAAALPSPDPWDELVALGQDDGWRCMYDLNNPDTWTLRDAGGGSMFYSAVADSMGNEADLVQATTGDQPPQVTVGSYKAAEFNASRSLARATGDLPVPRTIVAIIRPTGDGGYRNFLGDGSSNLMAQSATYRMLISDGISTNLESADNQLVVNTPVVFSGIFASGTNGGKTRKNGTQINQGTFSSLGTGTGIRLGYGFTGQISFLAVYNGALTGSSDALSRMETLLKTHYGIS